MMKIILMFLCLFPVSQSGLFAEMLSYASFDEADDDGYALYDSIGSLGEELNQQDFEVLGAHQLDEQHLEKPQLGASFTVIRRNEKRLIQYSMKVLSRYQDSWNKKLKILEGKKVDLSMYVGTLNNLSQIFVNEKADFKSRKIQLKKIGGEKGVDHPFVVQVTKVYPEFWKNGMMASWVEIQSLSSMKKYYLYSGYLKYNKNQKAKIEFNQNLYQRPYRYIKNDFALTSVMGTRFLNQNREFHPGVDIALARQTSVYSAGEGVVIFAGRSDGYGNLVAVLHPNKHISYYAHLEGINKKIVDQFKQGKLTYVRPRMFLGKSGSTGKSTGPHLHFELIGIAAYKGSRALVSVDPLGQYGTFRFHDRLKSRLKKKDATLLALSQ